MHEASLAQSILETVCRQCQEADYSRILEIRLRIGQASGVQTEALAFAFDVCKGNTLAREASLVIEQVPFNGSCKKCGKIFEISDKYVFNCPNCRSTSFTISSGFEMQIVDMEVE
jgi:hydrogenase nickel incorporation protein HypA/HybF